MAFPSPRAICVAASGKRVVILHVFVKKTQKTPKQIQARIKAGLSQAGVARRMGTTQSITRIS
ncbi:MAG: type II toxin-antitoxin system RelE/ParE family toxin [Acidithiobacillus sp.]|uniref:type II toxin-antitoxin system RelE/ParE family toxin n=1 Tax=Acidithiobacillus ferruginosus TaxID=3063951 RepID=UPI001D018E21|nr:hypothetical protein [Acidithiobacillus ferruginosus]MDA8378920.1 type II toxin-antitoxin system RelE/ParE family toxin [Planctomycetia bacterium]